MEPLQPSSALFVYSILPALFLCFPYALVTSILLNLYEFRVDADACDHPTIIVGYTVGTLVHANLFLFFTISVILLSPVRCFRSFLGKFFSLFALVASAAGGVAAGIYFVIPDMSRESCNRSVLFINALAGIIILALIVIWAILTIVLSQLHQLCWCCCKRRSDADERLRMQKATAQRKHQEWLLRERNEEDRLFGYVRRRPGDVDMSAPNKPPFGPSPSAAHASPSSSAATTASYGDDARSGTGMRHSAPPSSATPQPAAAPSSADDKDIIRGRPRKQVHASADAPSTPSPPARAVRRTGAHDDGSSEDEELDVHPHDDENDDENSDIDDAKHELNGDDDDLDEPRTPRPRDLPVDAQATSDSRTPSRRTVPITLTPLPPPIVAPHAHAARTHAGAADAANVVASPDDELVRMRALRERLTREQLEREQYLEREQRAQANERRAAQLERERQALHVDAQDMPLFGGTAASSAASSTRVPPPLSVAHNVAPATVSSSAATAPPLSFATLPSPTASARALRIDALRQRQLASTSSSPTTAQRVPPLASPPTVPPSRAPAQAADSAASGSTPLHIDTGSSVASQPFDLDATPTEFARRGDDNDDAPRRSSVRFSDRSSTDDHQLVAASANLDVPRYDAVDDTGAGALRHAAPPPPPPPSSSLSTSIEPAPSALVSATRSDVVPAPAPARLSPSLPPVSAVAPLPPPQLAPLQLAPLQLAPLSSLSSSQPLAPLPPPPSSLQPLPPPVTIAPSPVAAPTIAAPAFAAEQEPQPAQKPQPALEQEQPTQDTFASATLSQTGDFTTVVDSVDDDTTSSTTTASAPLGPAAATDVAAAVDSTSVPSATAL